MDSCNLFCLAVSGINWIWFAVAVIVTYAIGALWYSVFFLKIWMRVFKIDMPEKVTTGNFLRTMGLQVIVNILFGFIFFILTEISVWVALLALIGFCGWEKGELNFQFARFKDYWLAAIVRAGYTFVAGIIFILFALI